MCKNHSVNANVNDVSRFNQDNGVGTYPRVWLDTRNYTMAFSTSPRHIIHFKNLKFEDSDMMRSRDDRGWHFSWNAAKREIYSETVGKIWIWDWNGRLKKQVSYRASSRQEAVFSPDGQSLLVSIEPNDGGGNLRRLDVHSGTVMASAKVASCGGLGFSPDGQLVWFIPGDLLNRDRRFDVVRASSFQPLWNAPCSGPVKWLPDGRIGIVQKDGFEWRDATGRTLRHLRGPFCDDVGPVKSVTDWTLSPDKKWIYSCQWGGNILRWRAD